ncbi:hypothetical protein [Salipiger abyssi]|uniref:hypothetical protein n=1 Tax=Salipiger abyssi TaxID=1250539 RepID=UPI001A8FA37D|nr:hypothetical protein [Salipiger abyssi]MBN9886503.1 hypothetical protein [Salipiger abyssi]
MRKLLLLMIGLVAYAATLLVSQRLLAGGTGIQPVRVLVALTPMIPALFICAVVIRAIRDLDEMQRKLQFEALALSFMGTALITFAYGFLEGMGFPKISMFAVWPLMAAIWFIGVMVGRLRFR